MSKEPTSGGCALPPQYDPESYETQVYQRWEAAAAFGTHPREGGKPYTIVIPPPNVTGVLHIGHALNNTLQDLLIRWRRMQGHETLWLPGTDHAGIATQNVVEKYIAREEGKTRYQLGRVELIRRIWAWREQYGNTILQQLRSLGASCDWSRTRFTLDEGLSRAVRAAFVRLHGEGLLYRGKYLVNWCPRCRTTLSDDEVEHEEVRGKLYELHYPLVQPAAGRPHLTVATTRPETMLGDTAVAVHPGDERYQSFVGQRVELPLTGRQIPVIADAALELGFGTGCLKVTPAHDPTDYQIARRHKLEMINILTEDGRLNENVPAEFRGLDRFAGREAVLKALRRQGLLGKIENYSHQVGHCYRCHTMIEPYLTTQWFVNMKPLSQLAVKATEEGRVCFHPERWTKVYLQWFQEVRDWPISRQIWWGHQIPAWYCLEDNGEAIKRIEVGPDDPCDVEENGRHIRYIIGEGAKPIVSEEDPSGRAEFRNKKLIRDPDVLDTWFSSALWPFSTLGWPERTPDLEYYYPTDALVTERSIIYFWVARMVMMGELLMQREPFRHVVIHGTVLDGEGVKVSKSAGNGIDPVDIIRRYGADATRFTILDMATEGQDMRLPVQILCPHCGEAQELSRKRTAPLAHCRKCRKEFQQPVPNEEPLPSPPAPPPGHLDSKRFEKGRNFANKVWNAARFVLLSVDAADVQRVEGQALAAALRDEDRWILSRLNHTIRDVTEHLEGFEFSKAMGALYSFFWDDFCAWTIELSKPRLAAPHGTPDRIAAQAVLLHVLDRSLRLLHPSCPFLTEVLWGELGKLAPPGPPRNLGLPEVPRAGGGAAAGGELLATALWPATDEALISAALEAQFDALFEAVRAVRNIRQKNGLPPKARLRVSVKTSDEQVAGRLKAEQHVLMQMACIEPPEIGPDAPKPRPAGHEALRGADLYVALAGLIDLDKEKARLEKEIARAQQAVAQSEKKLGDQRFLQGAPPDTVRAERARLEEYQEKVAKLKEALEELA